MSSEVALSTRSHDGVRIVRVDEKRITVRNAIALRKKLSAEAEKCPELLLVDLGNVRFMDSSGLGALVAGLKELGQEGKMALCGAQGKVGELLRLTHMDRVIRTYADADEAVADLTRQ